MALQQHQQTNHTPVFGLQAGSGGTPDPFDVSHVNPLIGGQHQVSTPIPGGLGPPATSTGANWSQAPSSIGAFSTTDPSFGGSSSVFETTSPQGGDSSGNRAFLAAGGSSTSALPGFGGSVGTPLMEPIKPSGTSTPNSATAPAVNGHHGGGMGMPKVSSTDNLDDAFSKLGLGAANFSLGGGTGTNPFTGSAAPVETKKDNPFAVAANPPKKTINNLRTPPPTSSVGGSASLLPQPAPVQSQGGIARPRPSAQKPVAPVGGAETLFDNKSADPFADDFFK